MAQRRVHSDRIEGHLTPAEKTLALSSDDLVVQRDDIRSATITDDPWVWIRGIRRRGTEIPLVVAVGVWKYHGGTDFVIVKLTIEFRAEMHYPGIVDIGTRLARIGNSSFTMNQALFNEGRCAATAESVCVIISKETRRPVGLPERTKQRLVQL